jgi:hypothetical protein
VCFVVIGQLLQELKLETYRHTHRQYTLLLFVLCERDVI